MRLLPCKVITRKLHTTDPSQHHSLARLRPLRPLRPLLPLPITASPPISTGLVVPGHLLVRIRTRPPLPWLPSSPAPPVRVVMVMAVAFVPMPMSVLALSVRIPGSLVPRAVLGIRVRAGRARVGGGGVARLVDAVWAVVDAAYFTIQDVSVSAFVRRFHVDD